MATMHKNLSPPVWMASIPAGDNGYCENWRCRSGATIIHQEGRTAQQALDEILIPPRHFLSFPSIGPA